MTAALLTVATVALGLGIAYQGDREVDDPATVSTGPGPAAAVGGGVTSTAPVNPIEGFLPRSGAGSACREPVGVDLIDGYGATLTINGVAIAPEQMNVVLAANGEITREITASRSLGQYTFGPEPDCPNGDVIRATDNVLEACVYRLDEGPGSCVVTAISFDAL